MATIHPGYMGYAAVGTPPFLARFADANITARQDVLIPDMVMGHYDRAAYNFGKVEIGGSMSGPVTENFAVSAASIFSWAYDRDDCGGIGVNDMTLHYFCDSSPTSSRGSRAFPNLMINSCTFSCAAGDIAQFTIDLIGYTQPTWGSPDSGAGITVTEKLVTWDNVDVTLTCGDIVHATNSLLSNFEFTIANNVEYFYALDSTKGFYPSATIPGLRTITGSLSAYDPVAFDGVFGYDTQEPGPPPGTSWSAGPDGSTVSSIIEFSIGPTTIQFYVRFHRVEPALGTGPIISTIGFTGVGVQAQSLT